MYLPKIYKEFSEKFPEVFKSYQQLGQTCRHAGPLTEKDQNLVKLGISIGANSRGAVMSHTRRAIDAGATRGEINHVALLAMTTTGFPNMMAAIGWISEVIDDET